MEICTKSRYVPLVYSGQVDSAPRSRFGTDRNVDNRRVYFVKYAHHRTAVMVAIIREKEVLGVRIVDYPSQKGYFLEGRKVIFLEG